MIWLSGILVSMVVSLESPVRVLPAWAEVVAEPVQVQKVNGETIRFDQLSSQPTDTIILLPVFTSCKATCPPLTQNLKKAVSALSDQNLRVIVFSFDHEDSLESLEEYRRIQDVPDSWILLRSDAESIRQFYDAIFYKFRSDEGGYVHPNQLYVFDGALHWRSVLIGTNFTPEDLKIAVEIAQSGSGLLSRLIRNYELWAIVGGVGLVLGLLAAMVFMMTRKPRAA